MKNTLWTIIHLKQIEFIFPKKCIFPSSCNTYFSKIIYPKTLVKNLKVIFSFFLYVYYY